MAEETKPTPPTYADGRVPKIGDQVVGRTLNQPDVIAGVLVTPTTVEWRRAVKLDERAPTGKTVKALREANLRIDEHAAFHHNELVVVQTFRDGVDVAKLLHAEDALELALQKAGEVAG